MLPLSSGRRTLAPTLQAAGEPGKIFGGTNIGDGHDGELFARESVAGDGGLVDGDESERFAIEDPGGQGARFKELKATLLEPRHVDKWAHSMPLIGSRRKDLRIFPRVAKADT